MNNTTRVGVGIIVKKQRKVLLGKRKSAHGEGTWGFPGGHLEFMETFEQCVVRELQEETSMKVKNIHFGSLTNDFFVNEKKHYITVYMLADYTKGKAVVMEPDKCEKWEWFSWDTLPTPLFLPIQNLLKQGYNPF